jgi:hypothetical protein
MRTRRPEIGVLIIAVFTAFASTADAKQKPKPRPKLRVVSNTTTTKQPTPSATPAQPATSTIATVATTTSSKVPVRDGVVKKDTTPVTQAQIAYAADLAFVGAGQLERIETLGQTWYLNRIFNGGSGKYVGTGGQCIFVVAAPTIVFGPDNCAAVDLLIDGWIRFPKTAAVAPTPGVTALPTPQFTTNPAINGPAPSSPVQVTIPVTPPTTKQTSAPAPVAVPAAATPMRFPPEVFTAPPTGTVTWTLRETNGVIGYDFIVVNAQTGESYGQPCCAAKIQGTYESPFSVNGRYALGQPPYRFAIRAVYSDGTYGPYGYSRSCTTQLSDPKNVQTSILVC